MMRPFFFQMSGRRGTDTAFSRHAPTPNNSFNEYCRGEGGVPNPRVKTAANLAQLLAVLELHRIQDSDGDHGLKYDCCQEEETLKRSVP